MKLLVKGISDCAYSLKVLLFGNGFGAGPCTQERWQIIAKTYNLRAVIGLLAVRAFTAAIITVTFAITFTVPITALVAVILLTGFTGLACFTHVALTFSADFGKAFAFALFNIAFGTTIIATVAIAATTAAPTSAPVDVTTRAVNVEALKPWSTVDTR